MTGKEIVNLWQTEWNKTSNWRSLWQKTADLVFPRENQIETSTSSGSENPVIIWDNTAQQDSKEMAAGMSVSIFPSGQKAFGLGTHDASEAEMRYLARATEIEHEEMFSSNLMLELNESLRSWGVFGTCNLFTDWTVKDGLSYKDYDISQYQILENSEGIVDTMMLSIILTARQAVQKFGKNLPNHILAANDKEDTMNDTFQFIHFVHPRNDRNPNLVDAVHMPFESAYVDVQGGEKVFEGGYEQFPYAVARYAKRSKEVFGRGQGVDTIRDILVLQQMKKDWLELANRFNNPPLLVDHTFEGRVNLSPGAQNMVVDMNGVKSLLNQLGNYPVTEKSIEAQQDIIHRAFYKDIFAPLRDLTARMTTVEVAERMREGFRQLAPPVARLQRELLDPLIIRSFLLLVRNGVIPPIPESLSGRPIRINYEGPLALALKNQEARGWLEFASTAAQLSEIYPEARDYIDLAKGLPAVARSMGVKEDHLPTPEAIAEKQRIRAEQQAAQQALMAGQQIADAYGKTTGAPEEGSAAGKVMEAVGA